MTMSTYVSFYVTLGNTVRKKTLAVKKFGEFGELLAIRQSFFRQFSKVNLVTLLVVSRVATLTKRVESVKSFFELCRS